MDYQQLINGLKRFGSCESDICKLGLGVTPDAISERVIIAPWWEPHYFPELGSAVMLNKSDRDSVKVWKIGDITYIKTGIGAPVSLDAVLALGVTRCERAVFIGSVGSISENIGIGDIVIPKYSVCGEGAGRYIASDNFDDKFGQKVYPDEEMFEKLCGITEKVCCENNVKWHLGRNFSIDTIFAQFAHIDKLIDMGCNVVEMETSAVFRAAKLAGIKMAALFSVSDNTVKNKSLASGRTEEEMQYRSFVRKTMFPKILKDVLS